MSSRTYLVIEEFRNGDAAPVYRRLRERGRGIPDGLRHVGSWVTEDLGRCYQVMECADRALLDRWIEGWSDLVEFRVVPVISSAEAAAALARSGDSPRLEIPPRPRSGRPR